MRFTLFFIYLFFFSYSICLRGQDIQLDPLTITSSLVEKRASETGRNIISIQGSTLSSLPVHSIDEMLRYLPGVEVQARGPMGSQSDIVLRGGTFQQVLVILDGIRLNDPNTGHFSSYIPIAPSEIERIEILKGASSALYGSEAVGGVIHIITKSFNSRLDSTSTTKRQFSGSVGTGMHGLLTLQGGGNWQQNKAAFSVGILSNNTHGEMQRGTHGYAHNHTLSASSKIRLDTKTTLALRSSIDLRRFAAQNFYTTLVSDTAREHVKSKWLHTQLVRQINNGKISLDISYKHLVDEYTFNPSSTANQSTSQLLQGLLSWSHNLKSAGSFVTGIHFQNKRISSNDRGNHQRDALAPFITYQYTIGNFHIHPSLRADWRETLGIEWVPQINLSYKRNQWQWRSTIGKSIRDADFTERFNNYNKSLVTGGSIGNPALIAEKAISYEIGADWFASSSLKISTTGFERRHQDLIDYIPTAYDLMPRKENLSPKGNFALASNIAKVNTRGIELDIQYRKKITNTQTLFFTLGNQWLQSKSATQIISFYLTSHAKWITNATVHYQLNRLQFTWSGLYKNRDSQTHDALQVRLTPNYFVANIKCAYQLPKTPISAYVQVDNLTNTSYMDLLGAKMPSRWLMGGIKFNW